MWDETLIAVGRDFCAAWNARDAKKLASHVAEDVCFIDYAGHLLRGRQPFEDAHAAVLNGVMHRSWMTVVSTSILHIGSHSAALLMQWRIDGEIDASGVEMPSRQGHLTFVAVETEQRTELRLIQNTEIKQAAGAEI